MWPLLTFAGVVVLGGGVAATWSLGQQNEITAPPVAGPPVLKPQTAAPRLVIPAGYNCYIDALANGATFNFLIDTGAWSIAFGKQDARALGFDPDALRYDGQMTTANGIGHYADIRLKELRLSDFVLRDVEAHVTETRMDNPLLGMSVLKLLHVELKDGECILNFPPQYRETAEDSPPPAVPPVQPRPAAGPVPESVRVPESVQVPCSRCRDGQCNGWRTERACSNGKCRETRICFADR